MADYYGVRCREADLETVVKESQVIITITSCFEPLFPSQWVNGEPTSQPWEPTPKASKN